MTTVEDFLRLIRPSDRVRIVKGATDIYVGFMAGIEEDVRQQVMTEQLEQFRAVPEIRHKKYKELGLMEPLEPDQTPQYSFSDLQMSLYYTMILKDQEGKV